jgi:type IV secretory pathway TrbD component
MIVNQYALEVHLLGVLLWMVYVGFIITVTKNDPEVYVICHPYSWCDGEPK